MIINTYSNEEETWKTKYEYYAESIPTMLLSIGITSNNDNERLHIAEILGIFIENGLDLTFSNNQIIYYYHHGSMVQFFCYNDEYRYPRPGYHHRIWL